MIQAIRPDGSSELYPSRAVFYRAARPGASGASAATIDKWAAANSITIKDVEGTAPKAPKTRQERPQSVSISGAAIPAQRQGPRNAGDPYSTAICPLGCCIIGKPVCPECIAGACVLCGKHTHRIDPGYCSQDCAEHDWTITAPRLIARKTAED